MSAAVLSVEEDHSVVALAAAANRGNAPIRCVLLEDSRFDRHLVRRVAAKSVFDLELVEVSSIAEARTLLESELVDMMILDIALPDGSGIDFAEEMARHDRTNAIPFIVMTGADDQRATVSALRLGAADYLSKDELSTEIFDRAIENALRRSTARAADRDALVSNLSEENAALRRIALRNMRLLKGQLMPLLAFAWRMLRGDTLHPDERMRCAKALSRVTRTATGLIDDTVIVAATHTANAVDEPVDLQALVDGIIADDLGEIAASRAHIRVHDLPVIRAREAQMRMMFEELILTAIRTAPLGAAPEIEFGAAMDPAGDMIIWMVEHGLQLSARKQALSAQVSDLANPFEEVGRDAHSWSLCQRIAEKNDAQFRVAETEDSHTRIMIRFPKDRLAGAGPVAG